MSDSDPVCKHGSLRRQCYTCDLEADLDQRDAEIQRLRAQIRAINSSMDHHAATAEAKLADRDAEIEQLRAALRWHADQKERIRNANSAYITLWEEVDRLQSQNEGYAKSYDDLSKELAAERRRARLPKNLLRRLMFFADFDDAQRYDLLRDILAWHEQETRNE